MKKLITAGIALGLIGSVSLVQAQATDTADLIKVATENTSKWVETRTTISKESNQWRVDKELIQQKIDFYKSEISMLSDEIKKLSDEAEKGKGDRAAFATKIEELQRATRVVTGILPKYENQVKELVSYFPLPLQETAGKLAKNIPSNPETTRLGAGQRLAIIVGILNEVDRFNREVTVTKEVREVEGQTREFDIMYLGLGQAFYADSQGQLAGYATPAKGQWVWTSSNENAPQILRAIKVGQGKIKPAEFVELPLKITNIKSR